MPLLIPLNFTCSQCGYCCRKYGKGLSFTQDDVNNWIDSGQEWVYYHPFIDWVLYEFVAPIDGVIQEPTKKACIRALEKAEHEYEKDNGKKPKVFPWGRSLFCCPFLKQEEYVWSLFNS